MSEGPVLSSARLAIGRFARHARLFRNSVGEAWQGKPIGQDHTTLLLEHYRRVVYGLVPGSGDLIGWTSITITPDMVGTTVAVFTSGETKDPASFANRKRDEQQRIWRQNVLKAGGFASVILNDDDALRLVRAK